MVWCTFTPTEQGNGTMPSTARPQLSLEDGSRVARFEDIDFSMCQNTDFQYVNRCNITAATRPVWEALIEEELV
jgi:hypothetical protein